MTLPNSRPASYLSRVGIVIAIVVIVCIGTYLRLKSLDSRPFFVDEADSWRNGMLDWTNFWKIIWKSDGNMVFYYLLLRPWLHLGDSEWIIRSFSVIFGVATIPIIYLLGFRLFNQTVGLISATLFAVHGFHVFWSQVARGYSLVVFLITLSTYFFYSAVNSPDRKKYWVAYILTSTLAIYAHIFALLVLPAQWLSLDLVQLRRIRFSIILMLMVALALFTAPMLAFLLFGGKGQLDWIQKPTIWNVIYSATDLVGERGYRLLVAYVGIYSLPFVGVLNGWQLDFTNGIDVAKKWEIKLLFSWLVFPIAATILVSYTLKPILESRYLLICVPPLVLLAGYNIVRIIQVFPRFRILSLLAFILIFVLSTSGLKDFYKEISHDNAPRSVTRYIFESQHPHDGVFIYRPNEQLVFRYYAYQEIRNHGYTVLPDIIFPSDELLVNLSYNPTKSQVEASIRNRERVWLITNMEWWFTDNTENLIEVSMIRSVLSDMGFVLQEEKQFNQDGLPAKSVELYVKNR